MIYRRAIYLIEIVGSDTMQHFTLSQHHNHQIQVTTINCIKLQTAVERHQKGNIVTDSCNLIIAVIEAATKQRVEQKTV